MQLGTRFALALLRTTIEFSATSAEDAPGAKVFEELIPFSSDEGLARLARSTAKVDFPLLANQFEAQSNPAFCGPTSAAIVLNAVYGRNPNLPRDWSRLHEGDLKYAPSRGHPHAILGTQRKEASEGGRVREVDEGCRASVVEYRREPG
jgi:Phytochelatin synthase